MVRDLSDWVIGSLLEMSYPNLASDTMAAQVRAVNESPEADEGGLTFSFWGQTSAEIPNRLRESLTPYLTSQGFVYSETPPEHVRVVFNVIDAERPKPYRRKAQATFVVSWVQLSHRPDDILRAAYPLLIRSLSNLLVVFVPDGDDIRTHFITPEQGHYQVTERLFSPGYLQSFYKRLEPIITSRLVIDNEFHPDLPEELWGGDDTTEQLYRAGQRLAALNLLPAPFPLEDVLSPQDLRHLKRLYNMGGLSYGNLSARRDRHSFWMSASGVDKANMRIVGQDIQLVKGFDADRNVMLLSCPPNVTPRRVSVDAIEHHLIYQEHPGVGAIVHVHAWIEGTKATEVNYPCGTIQLASAVAGLIRESVNPARAIVGLKNHGLTITGTDLDDIFDRIDGKVVPTVPMS